MALLLPVWVLGPALLVCAFSLGFIGTLSRAAFRGTAMAVKGDCRWAQLWWQSLVTEAQCSRKATSLGSPSLAGLSGEIWLTYPHIHQGAMGPEPEVAEWKYSLTQVP